MLVAALTLVAGCGTPGPTVSSDGDTSTAPASSSATLSETPGSTPSETPSGPDASQATTGEYSPPDRFVLDSRHYTPGRVMFLTDDSCLLPGRPEAKFGPLGDNQHMVASERVEVGAGVQDVVYAWLYVVRAPASGLDPEQFLTYVVTLDPRTAAQSEPLLVAKADTQPRIRDVAGSRGKHLAYEIRGDISTAVVVDVTTGKVVRELTGSAVFVREDVVATQAQGGGPISVFRLSDLKLLGTAASGSVRSLWGRVQVESRTGTEAWLLDTGAKASQIEAIALLDLVKPFAYFVDASGGPVVIDRTSQNVVWKLPAERAKALRFEGLRIINGVLYAKTSDEQLAIDVLSGDSAPIPAIVPELVVGPWIVMSDKITLERF